MEPAPRFGLETLVGSTAGFRERHWPHTPLVTHGAPARFATLLDAPELQDARSLIAAAVPPILIFGKGGLQTRLPDSSLALPLFEAGGCTLYLPALHSISAVRRCADALADDLGLHPEWIYCEGFLSNRGGGVGLHYDFDLNFNVQLRGTKRWRIAANGHVESPIATYIAGDASSTPVPVFARQPLPRRMPRDAQSFVLEPGSVMFLPRGYWHETEVDGESFALSFVIKPPTWRALVLSELGKRLDLEPRWREHALALDRGDGERDRLHGRLAELLAELAKDVSALVPKEVFAAYESGLGLVRFRWPPGGSRSLTEGAGGWVLEIDREGRRQKVELEAELAPFVAWLVAAGGVVTVGLGCEACPDLAPDLIEQTLKQLAGAGLLVAAE